MTAAATPEKGGTLVVALDADPPFLNVAMNGALETTTVAPQIQSVLCRIDAAGKAVPDLADSWNISSDGLTYTFHLHPGVKWTDGVPFTSADVAYSLLQVNRKYNGVATSGLAPIDTIDAPDANTVIFHMKFAFPPLLTGAICAPNTSVIVPKHLYEGTDALTNPANLKPVGTGPFMLKEWVKGDHITLVRNPDYFKTGQPYLDTLVFKIIPDAAARVDALLKGEVDYLPYYVLPTSSVPDLQKAKGITVQIDRNRPTFAIVHNFFNLRNPILAKKEVRQAIAYSVDRKAIVAKALDGLADVGSGPISSQQKDLYNSDINKYDLNTTKANQLLDQAGYPKKADGTRFNLRLLFLRGGEAGALDASADIIRENLKAVGIVVDQQAVDTAAFNTAAYTKWDFDMAMTSIGTGPDPAIGVSRLYLSTNIKPVTAANLMGYTNLQIDQLFNQGAQELDQAKRVTLYKQVQSILNDDVPALWLWEKVAPLATRANIQGFPSGPTHWEPYDAVWVQSAVSQPSSAPQAPGISSQGTDSTPFVLGAVALLVVIGGWLVVSRGGRQKA